MQTLYVTELTIESVDRGNDSLSIVCHHVAKWINSQAGSETCSEYYLIGEKAVAGEFVKGVKSGEWESLGAGDTWAFRVHIADVQTEKSRTFHTQITLGILDSKVKLRVSLAQSALGSGLSPLGNPDIRQPGIIGNLSRDRRLKILADGEMVGNGWRDVRTERDIRWLGGRLIDSQRLPIVIVHSRTEESFRSVKFAANKIIGLASVVTVNYPVVKQLMGINSKLAPEYGAAVVIWSDVTADVFDIPYEVVNSQDSSEFRDVLMDCLSPLSVVWRSKDSLFDRARRSAFDQKLIDARKRSEKARLANNLKAEVEFLREQEIELTRESSEWQQISQEYADKNEELETMVARIPQLESKIKHLEWTIREKSNTQHSEKEVVEIEVPKLKSHDQSSIRDVLEALSRRTGGKFEFTNDAVKSWKKVKYPHPDDMRDKLIALADIASAVYGSDGSVEGRLVEWARENYGIRISLSDDTIEKDKNLRYFDYDGNKYDRTPHVKVNDNCPPSEVGRIYFALDDINRRMIVDHVALKLYGI